MAHTPKRTKLPARYEAGFLEELDRRSGVYKQLRTAYETIVEDAGGEDQLSHVKLSLIERFVFLEACLSTWEHRIATNPKASEEMLSRWIQGLNSLQGLAKTIGLERQVKRSATLKSYVKERRA